MYHNISLKDFDILALSHITINLDNLENIINLAFTCKDYYNELLYLLKTSKFNIIENIQSIK